VIHVPPAIYPVRLKGCMADVRASRSSLVEPWPDLLSRQVVRSMTSQTFPRCSSGLIFAVAQIAPVNFSPPLSCYRSIAMLHCLSVCLAYQARRKGRVRGVPGPPRQSKALLTHCFGYTVGLTFQSPKIKLLPPDGRFLG